MEASVAEDSDEKKFSEILRHESSFSEAKTAAENTVTIPRFKTKRSKAMLAIESFDFDEDGNPIITWSNGIMLTLTAESVSAGHIKFCGHDISISQSIDGTRIQVDGISMLLPNAA